MMSAFITPLQITSSSRWKESLRQNICISLVPKQEVLHAELLDDVIAEQSEALFVPHDGT